jgi:hypothetical protein
VGLSEFYYFYKTKENKMSNYPDNVNEHDPRAPWNRKEVEYLIVSFARWKYEMEVKIKIDGSPRCFYIPEPDASQCKTDKQIINYIKTNLL